MCKYMLISVFDRDITTEKFNTLAAAQAAMKEEMIKYGGVPESFFTSDRNLGCDYDECDFNFDEYTAYVNDAPITHCDCDWEIVEL